MRWQLEGKNTLEYIVEPMNQSLRTRLLVIFAVLSLTIVFLTVWLTRIAFERGFIEYLDQQNLLTLESAAEVLSEHYSQEGSWDTLRGNALLWRQLIEVRRGPAPPPFYPLRREQFNPGDYQEGLPQAESYPPPEYRSESNSGEILLVDENEEWVGGRRPNQAIQNWLRIPVEVDDQVVGYLLRTPTIEISEGLDQSFVSSQLRSSVLIAILTLALALPFALYIAARLLSPIKSLTAGIEKLTRGEYGNTIEIESRDELGQLARDLNALGNTLRSNQTAQQRWISDISHELRTPIAILEGEIFAIIDGIRKPNPAEMESLAAEVKRLSKLINDLHQLSKSDAGDLSYKIMPLEIRDVLEQSIQSFGHRVSEVGLKLDLKVEVEDAWVSGDESRLIQLFSNLLENSCRYTDAPGEIQIEVSGDKNEIRVVFSDSSPGVTDAEMPQLFDRLYRVEQSRNRASGGSGLGLSICQNIAQAHGARLEADHSNFGGLKMSCIFPRYNDKRGNLDE